MPKALLTVLTLAVSASPAMAQCSGGGCRQSQPIKRRVVVTPLQAEGGRLVRPPMVAAPPVVTPPRVIHSQPMFPAPPPVVVSPPVVSTPPSPQPRPTSPVVRVVPPPAPSPDPTPNGDDVTMSVPRSRVRPIEGTQPSSPTRTTCEGGAITATTPVEKLTVVKLPGGFTIAPDDTGEVSFSDRWNVITRATCRVTVSGSCGSGTVVGFEADKDAALVLTNAHVAGTRRGRRVNVQRWDIDGTSERGTGEIIAAGYGRGLGIDYALLRCEGFAEDVIPIPMADRYPDPSEGLATNGCPRCEWPSMQSLQLLRNQAQVLTWYPEAIGGRSGSGVYDFVDGRPKVVGLLTWGGGGKGLGQSAPFVLSALRGRLPSAFERVPAYAQELQADVDVDAGDEEVEVDSFDADEDKSFGSEPAEVVVDESEQRSIARETGDIPDEVEASPFRVPDDLDETATVDDVINGRAPGGRQPCPPGCGPDTEDSGLLGRFLGRRPDRDGDGRPDPLIQRPTPIRDAIGGLVTALGNGLLMAVAAVICFFFGYLYRGAR